MKETIKIPMTLFSLLIISSSLIYFGSRNDAVSIARSLKSGVLMADEINVAFQNVGGQLVTRYVQESQNVQKGDILMILDDTDTVIAIEQIKAIIQAQEALIQQEETATRIENDEINLTELTTWHKIKEVQASLDAAKATKALANIDFERNSKLSQTGSVSQSLLDNVQNALTKASMVVIQTESQLAAMVIGATESQLVDFMRTKQATGMSLQSIVNAREKWRNRNNKLAQLRAQLMQTKAELKQLEVNHSRLTLTAPENGKVLKVIYDEGEIIPVGAPAVIVETERKYVDIYVNENMVSNYLPNANVKISIPALKGQTTGIVRYSTATSSFADLRTTREHGQADLTSFQVRIYVEQIPQLLTGMTAEVNHAERN